MRRLIQGKNVYFEGELLPFKVMAESQNFAICTRKFDKKADADTVAHLVKTRAYSSAFIANGALKDEIVYTIVGFKHNERGSHNLVFNLYDFENQKSIKELMKDLESGEAEISRRNKVDLNINWEKTPFLPF